MESVNPIIQLVAAAGFGSVVVAIIGVFGARKLNQANVVAKSVESSDIQIENLTADNTRLRQQMKDADEEVRIARGFRDMANEKVRQWFARADRHAAWDRRQLQRLEELGIDDPMPSLYPPPGE